MEKNCVFNEVSSKKVQTLKVDKVRLLYGINERFHYHSAFFTPFFPSTNNLEGGTKVAFENSQICYYISQELVISNVSLESRS